MKLCLCLVVALLAVGCYRTTAFTGLPRGGPTYDHNAAHFIAGASSAEVDVGRDCPAGVAAITTRHSFLDMLLAWITLEIYTPTSIEVECASPPQPQYAPQPVYAPPAQAP